MSQEDYIKQLEEENTALKKKLEEKPIEEQYHNNILNIKSLNDITEETPLVIYDAKNNPLHKLVSAYRNKKNGYVVMKMKTKKGWFGKYTYKNVQNFFDDTVSFPISTGDSASDVNNGWITNGDCDAAQGFFRMIESIGLVNRSDRNVGL
jgi:hypothetical protein